MFFMNRKYSRIQVPYFVSIAIHYIILYYSVFITVIFKNLNYVGYIAIAVLIKIYLWLNFDRYLYLAPIGSE